MAWKHLFGKSASDHGTLAFFRSKLNRVAVTKNPKNCVDAAIDFFGAVTKGHWLACACSILGINNMDEALHILELVLKATNDQKLFFIRSIAREVVERATLVENAFFPSQATNNTADRVYNYARVLCHYGSLVAEFRDGWAEGDGERMMRCWRLFLPHFKASGCSKYALEALRIQFQLQVLSPNLAHQVKWHRFMNTRGGMGMNIPCDLYNEHVNKQVKTVIQNMGSNLTEQALKQAVRCISPLHTACKGFDAATNVPIISSQHTRKSDAEDIRKVVISVLRRRLLEVVGPRKHQCFPNMESNPLDHWDHTDTIKWIKEKKREYGKYKGRYREREQDDFDSEEESSDEETQLV